MKILLKIIVFIGFWGISIVACSEKKDTLAPARPDTAPPTTITPVIDPITPKPTVSFFNDSVMKKANLVWLYKIENSGAKWTKIETPETTVFNDLWMNCGSTMIYTGLSQFDQNFLFEIFKIVESK